MAEGPFGGPRPLADRDPVYELRFKVITDELLGGGDAEDLEYSISNRDDLIASVDVTMKPHGLTAIKDPGEERVYSIRINIEPGIQSDIDDRFALTNTMVDVCQEEIESRFDSISGGWDIV